MDLSHQIHNAAFRNYIKVAYAKRTQTDNDDPLEELASRLHRVFCVEAECIGGELFLFDNRYMLVCARVQRNDLSDMVEVAVYCAGPVFLYLIDMTGEYNGLEGDCTVVTNRAIPESPVLYC